MIAPGKFEEYQRLATSNMMREHELSQALLDCLIEIHELKEQLDDARENAGFWRQKYEKANARLAEIVRNRRAE